MNTKLINSNGCKRLIEVEVPAGEVEAKFLDVFKEIAKVAEVPGFRPGKVPHDIIEKRFREHAEEEVLKELVSNSYDDAVKHLNLLPIALPKLSEVKLERGKPLTYKAEFDIKPEIKISAYKGLKIAKNKVKIENSDVEKALSGLQDLNAKFTSADERPVSKGDYIICDLNCTQEENEVFSKESVWLSTDEETGIRELHSGIIGMKKDDEKEISVKLPDSYPDNNLAGKNVLYKVKVKHVKEKKVPLMDDDFAKDLGKGNITELKDAVRQDLLKRAEISIKENIRMQILESLIKNSTFDVPESMVERYLENMVEDAKERLFSQGLSEKDIESHKSKIEEKLSPQALNQVKIFFILHEIAARENIKVEPNEVDKTLEVIAGQLKKDKKKLLEEYEEKNLMQNIISQIQEEKTIEFLIKEAEVTEK